MTRTAHLKLKGYITAMSIVDKGVIVKDFTPNRFLRVGSKDIPVVIPNLILNSGKDLIASTLIGNCSKYLEVGEGSTPASATDTTLESPIGGRTNTYMTSHPYTGTAYDKENGIIKLRRTHDSAMFETTKYIREIGFAPSDTGSLFSRIVFPEAITIQPSQQLRLTYEISVTLEPIVAEERTPTIYGWSSKGDTRLEGYFPDTNEEYTSNKNAFLASIDTEGSCSAYQFSASFFSATSYQSLLEPSVKPRSDGANMLLFYDRPGFNTFGANFDGTGYTLNTNVFAFCGSQQPNPPNGQSDTLITYVSGNYYRDLRVIVQPMCPNAINITGLNCISCRGITHVFDNYLAKLNVQRLTLNFRVAW